MHLYLQIQQFPSKGNNDPNNIKKLKQKQHRFGLGEGLGLGVINGGT
jgi:hypothetical protein